MYGALRAPRTLPMDDVDLNLLVSLDALLAEASVTGAARRLGLSASAMSRTLTRLRAATGDPLLVRAGRGLVRTPRADDLRDHVHALARDASAVLRPLPRSVELAALERTFTIRASEGFLEFLAALVVAAVAEAAPRVRLHFVAKADTDARPLRDGTVDLEVGVQAPSAPELRTRLLFRDGFVGVARLGHLCLAGAEVTRDHYAACRHVASSREGGTREAIDRALGTHGLKRNVMVVVPGYPDAIRIARQSDLLALVPASCLAGGSEHESPAVSGIVAFDLPMCTPTFGISAMWHPRMDADPGHRSLRETVISACQQACKGRR